MPVLSGKKQCHISLTQTELVIKFMSSIFRFSAISRIISLNLILVLNECISESKKL